MADLRVHAKEIKEIWGIDQSHKLYQIEMKAEEHLNQMTERGVRISTKKLDDLIRDTQKDLMILLKDILDTTGGMVKAPNSPAQVALYFQSIGVTLPKTMKGNPQVNQETLTDLGLDIADKICEYRKKLAAVSQMKSVRESLVGDRVHPTYVSTKCATGRIYTAAPNIQGWGEQAKSVIIPDDGYKLMTADYKAQELRVVAAVSGCKKMLEAFENGADLHRTTYSLMTGVPVEEVTDEQRSIGKVLNFATIYGQRPEGLARKLKTTKEEAERLQGLYFQTYPEIKRWVDTTIRNSHRTRSSATPWGRTRKISFYGDVDKAERQAVNTPIQGAGADIMKRALAGTNLNDDRVQVLTTIHDSLVIQYRDNLDPERVERWLRSRMELSFLGKVELEVDVK